MNIVFVLLAALALPLAPRVASAEPLAEVDGHIRLGSGMRYCVADSTR